jgi:hypothetical protein
MASGPKTLVLDHDDLIASLVKVRKQIDREKVVAAFVCSLPTKRLDLRSPFGSYAFHLNHPRHKLDGFNPAVGTNYLQCTRCPFFSNQGRRDDAIDFKYYGKLRSTSTNSENFAGPAYALANLTLFADSPVPCPDDRDWDVLRQLLKRIRNLPGTARLVDLQKALTGLFKSDKYARKQVLEILGFCGVLQPRSRPLVTERFFYRDKDQFHPHFHTRDWTYPVSWWTGADGVNDEAVRFWFPKHVH